MRLTARTRLGIRARPTDAGSRSSSPLGALLVAVLAASVAGCTTLLSAPGGSGDTDGPTTGSEGLDRLHQQAEDALVRWAEAVRQSGGASITFVGELTSQIGEWEPELGSDYKAALAAGKVEAATSLPNDTPARKEVRWLDDGTKIDVNVLSARATLEELVASGERCNRCQTLRVTDASLGTGLVDTSRGPAEVPVWVYSLEGSAVRVTRVAVDGSVTVDPPAWNADDPPEGISIESAKGTEDSRDLTVEFLGAPDDASVPCGADYTGEAVESELAVVVIVEEHPYVSPQGSVEICDAMGRGRTVDIRLASKLQERAVLEVRQGLPVPVRAP